MKGQKNSDVNQELKCTEVYRGISDPRIFFGLQVYRTVADIQSVPENTNDPCIRHAHCVCIANFSLPFLRRAMVWYSSSSTVLQGRVKVVGEYELRTMV